MPTGKPDSGETRSVWATGRMRARAWAAASLFALLFAYDEAASHLWHERLWFGVAWVALLVIPLTFVLVLLALPWRNARGVGPVGIAFALLAVVLTWASFDWAADYARLAAATLLAWWFLEFFETLSWVVVVSCIIPWVDALSVWRGPTKTITTKHPGIFNKALSFGFAVPGERYPARLGVPDLLFFALFLAAAARFGLRLYATFAGMVIGLGATIALTVWWDVNGLPALPGIALGFLLPNLDLIWRRMRYRQPGTGDRYELVPPD